MKMKNKNPNHPRKGSSVKVEPIRNPKDIRTIKVLLKNKPRDFCLFVLGINTDFRVAELLKITAGEVRNIKGKGKPFLSVLRGKEVRKVALNKACVKAIDELLAKRPCEDDQPLFSGSRGGLTVPTVNRLVKQWCGLVNLKGNYGGPTLRKTFGYQQRMRYGTPISDLMELFNHSTRKQTISYLCLDEEKSRSIYSNEI